MRRLAAASLLVAASLLQACGGGGDAGVSVFDYVARQQGQTPKLVGTTSAPVVRYAVTGKSASAEISYIDENDATRTVQVLLPWSLEIRGAKDKFLWIWAQADATAQDIQVSISINDVERMTDGGTGVFGVASGWVSCC